MRILPRVTIVDLPVEHPMFSILFRVNPLPQIPALGSWVRSREDSEIGPSTVHYYGVFDDHGRLVVLVSMNSDVSDSSEREGDNLDYFHTYGGKGLCAGCERRRLDHDPLRSRCHLGDVFWRELAGLANHSSVRAVAVHLREAPERRLVPVRGHEQGCSADNLEFAGIAA